MCTTQSLVMLFIILLNENALGLVLFNSLFAYCVSDLIVNSKVNCREKFMLCFCCKKIISHAKCTTTIFIMSSFYVDFEVLLVKHVLQKITVNVRFCLWRHQRPNGR